MFIYSPPTRHARTRLAQRGVKQEIVQCILAFGDLEERIRGCTRLRLSARRAAELMLSREAPANCVRKAERLTLVIADDETIVTGYWSNPRARSAAKVHTSCFQDAA